MWDQLGFKENPYSTKPLQAREEDTDLLIGRNSETIDFATALESAKEGVVIISGVPGVGKTSFLNVVQYQLERKLLGFGPKIIAARKLCPVQSDDIPRDVALRALTSLVYSIESYCNLYAQKIPEEIVKVKNWISSEKGTSGLSFGIQVFNVGGSFGREVTFPSLSEITFEGTVELIGIVVQNSIKNLEASSLIIVLDNLENLEEGTLGELLMTFRDTLFSINNLYWIAIGQSGLGSLIQSLDARVFQRLTTSIELKPITSDELKKAIDIRTSKFHTNKDGKSFISENIYQKLYNCSNGEIRFVFKYCSEICIAYVQRIRKSVIAKGHDPKIVDSIFGDTMGDHLTKNELSDATANLLLKEIVQKQFDGLNLKSKDIEILNFIGKNKVVEPKDCKSVGIKAAHDFSRNYLVKLSNQNLLLRQQEGRVIKFRLRGLSHLAAEYDLLTKED